MLEAQVVRGAGAEEASPGSIASGPTFPADAVDTRLVDLGLLLGLLEQVSGTSASGTIGVNTSWFQSPLQNLAQFPERAAPLLDLLNRLMSGLSAPEDIDPADSAQAGQRNWYPITYQGTDTNFFVVLPAAAEPANNLISLGFSRTWAQNAFNAHVYGCFPAFEVPNAAAHVCVLGAQPIEAHLEVTNGSGATQVGFRLTGYFSFSALPTFTIQMLAGTAVRSTYNTVTALLADPSALALLNTLVALPDCQAFLGKKLGTTSSTPGTILGPVPTGLGWLAGKPGAYTLTDLHPFAGQDTLDTARNFFRVLLNAVASSSAPLIPVGTAAKGQQQPGIYVVSESIGGGVNALGIRIQLPPISLPVASAGSDAAVTLQVGSWLTQEQAGSATNPTWWERANGGTGKPPAPGLSLFLLDENAAGGLSFTGIIGLGSIGIDIMPPANQPLVKVGSFLLNGVQARGNLTLDLTASSPVSGYGGAVKAIGIGIPLGGSFGAGGGVAQSIVSAGGSSDPQSAEPVNPTFSLAASFLHGSTKPYDVQIYDVDGNPGASVQFPLQRSFGPIYLRTLDVGYESAAVQLGLDASVKLGPLGVDLTGFDIGIPVSHAVEPSQYTFGLSGLNVSFDSDPVALDAGLVSTGGQYIGEAMLTVGTFSIGAFGAYGTVGGQPSLFVFGWTNNPIGGPPYFYVHGLAAGFGYNRGLNLPGVTGVADFPFVAALGNPNAFGTGSRLDQANNALGQLIQNNYVPMERGAYWFSAGIAFRSFELVDSTALLAVEFGPDLAITLLGTSTLKMPAQGNPYVYAELALDVSLRPSAGTFLAQGQLTDNSFVIDPSCHLTGGFAFATWWQPPHEGEFVLTVGGYHPMFNAPTYYPVVPRLGFVWNVDSNVTVQGSAYFALTPSCVMGGGELQAVYSSGNLRAWFDAQADILIQWKPFYFIAGISISVGVSYKIHLLFVSVTLSVELGAGLKLWGPPTGGEVYVDWYVISFTISFGSSQGGAAALGWSDFVTQMLPNKAVPASAVAKHAHALDAAPPVVQPRVDISATGGVIRQDDAGDWTVRADGLAFVVKSTVPATKLSFIAPQKVPFNPDLSGYAMGIVPMQLASATSELDVTLTGTTGTIDGTFTAVQLLQNMPLAVWGTSTATPTQPSATSVSLPVGITVTADTYQAMGVPPIELAVLAYATLDPQPAIAGMLQPVFVPVSSNAVPLPLSAVENSGSLLIVQQTLPNTAAMRAAIVNALGDFGFGTGLTGAPTGLMANITASLRAPVMLGSPAGITWPAAAGNAQEIA